jgi:hypothetical protein
MERHKQIRTDKERQRVERVTETNYGKINNYDEIKT